MNQIWLLRKSIETITVVGVAIDAFVVVAFAVIAVVVVAFAVIAVVVVVVVDFAVIAVVVIAVLQKPIKSIDFGRNQHQPSTCPQNIESMKCLRGKIVQRFFQRFFLALGKVDRWRKFI